MAAPLSTTPTNGWPSTAASATASGWRAEAVGDAREHRVGATRAGQAPLASASLTMTPSPRVGARERVAGGALVQVPRHLRGVEEAEPERALERLRPARCRSCSAPIATPWARSSASAASTSSFSSTPLSGVAEWIW